MTNRHSVDLKDPAQFLHEYTDNLSHGSLVTPWPDAPPVGAAVEVAVHPPCGQPTITLRGTVFLACPPLAVLQLLLDAPALEALAACAESCCAEGHRHDAAAGAPGEWTGSLQDTPVYMIYKALSERRATGRLSLRSEGSSAEVHVQGGRIMLVVESPPVPGERLGDLLVARGALDRGARDAALARAREAHLALGEELALEHAVPKAVIEDALSDQVLARASHQLEREDGTFSFVEGAIPRPTVQLHPVDGRAALYNSLVERYRRWSEEELQAALTAHGQLFVHPGPDAKSTKVARLLHGKERELWRACDGQWRVVQIAAVSPLPRRQTYALVFALHAVGMIRFDHEMAPEQRIVHLRSALEAKLRGASGADPFTVLDVHWMATTAEVDAALASETEAWTLPPLTIPIPEDLRELSEDVLARLQRAHADLHDPIARHRARRLVVVPEQIAFAVELLRSQGDLAWFKGDMVDAIYRYSHIIELDPSDRAVRERLAAAHARRAAQQAHDGHGADPSVSSS